MDDKNLVRLTVDLPEELHKQLKLNALNEGITMKEYIIFALLEKMKNVGGEKMNEKDFQKIIDKIFTKHSDLFKRLKDM